jgi:hypothetical protein
MVNATMAVLLAPPTHRFVFVPIIGPGKIAPSSFVTITELPWVALVNVQLSQEEHFVSIWNARQHNLELILIQEIEAWHLC